MVICNICNELSSLPYKLICEHIFCFMCLKALMNTGSYTCPTCDTFISDDITKVKLEDLYKYTVEQRKIFWVYSSNYVNHWWCYDSESNIKLENIYNDYKSRLVTSSDDDAIEVKLDSSVIKNANKNSKNNEDCILYYKI